MIGLASTAPAYSLAAVIGLITLVVGPQAPAALLASFVPMFFIATAFYYMNRADPDAGTTFSWVTRTLGPWAGWIGGWAICVTGILVIGSLADVGARYTLLLVGWDSAAESKGAVTVFAVLIIVVMTAICILGTELSARIQNVMIIGQVGALLLFAVVALVAVYRGDATEASVRPEASWFSPFEIESSDALFSALLIGVFIYWGWESAVNLTEETKDSRRAPGLAAVFSTGILLITYVAVATAVVAFAGLELLGEFADDESIFSVLAADVLGSPWDKLVVLAIVTSAIASTQTTIIPASRTTLSMARSGAYPAVLARIHRRFRTPHVSTATIAVLAILWYVPLNLVSENFLFDTLSALALIIAFYYALSGVAMRRLLQARAEKVGSKRALHGCRAAPRRRASRLPLRRGHARARRSGGVVLGRHHPRLRPAARDRVRVPHPRSRSSRCLAVRRPRALLRAQAVRGPSTRPWPRGGSP